MKNNLKIGLVLDDGEMVTQCNFQLRVTVTKNPGLGFSIAGGSESQGNPYRPDDDVSCETCSFISLVSCRQHNICTGFVFV